MFQDCDGILVRPSVMRQRQAVQVKVVRLGVLRARARIKEAAGDAERRQQLLAYLAAICVCNAIRSCAGAVTLLCHKSLFPST